VSSVPLRRPENCLGLSEQQMTWALGLAATQPVGLQEMFGTMTKSFHPGRAAQNGLTSALLAARNFTSSSQSLEARYGWGNVLSTSQDFAQLTDRLGETHEISVNTYKPFPCGVVMHPTIDGCIQLRNEHQLTADAIDRVELKVHPLVLQLTSKKAPESGLESKFSIYHAASVALIEGAAGIEEFSDQAARNSSVIALRDRVTAVVDPSIKEEQVRATVWMKDGRRLEKVRRTCRRQRRTPDERCGPGGQVQPSCRRRLTAGSHPPPDRSVLERGGVERRCGLASGRSRLSGRRQRHDVVTTPILALTTVPVGNNTAGLTRDLVSGALMDKLRTAMLAATCAAVAVSATTGVSAQRGQRPLSNVEPVRHLVYIATPGDNGTDNPVGRRRYSTPTRLQFSQTHLVRVAGEQDARSQSVRHHGQPATSDALCDRLTAG
jgi:hypothetical protein